jgi:signal transduction histidine kinase
MNAPEPGAFPLGPTHPSGDRIDVLDDLFQQDLVSMAVWRGPDLKLERVNKVYAALFKGRELIGRRPLEAFPELMDQPDGHLLLDCLNRVFETGEPYTARERLVRQRQGPDGPLADRYYDVAYLRINGPDGEPYGVYDLAIEVTQGVTARQDREREREVRELFVALLTHDLRTPLSVAKMNMHLAALKADRPEGAARYVAEAMRAIDRVDVMIQNMLDATRIRAGVGLEVERHRFELVGLVRLTCDELAVLYGATFEIRAPHSLMDCWSDKDIRRVIENLGTNAIKYGDASRPIRVTVEEQGPLVSIAVHNEGPVIPTAEMPTLFESFRRTPGGRASRKGWGLGLSLVRGVAEAHGGTVDVLSDEETGTTFTVRLPIEPEGASTR